MVVVGGGITGLVAAYRLARLAAAERTFGVTLVEATEHLGGKLRTSVFMGHDVDEGADAFLRRDPAALELADELGLGERLVAPAQSTALIVRRRRKPRSAQRLALVPLGSSHVLGVPTGLWSLARSGLVGPLAVARAGLDLLMPDNWKGTDESVGAMVRRRLGHGVADGLVGPLLGGINAGDIDQMDAEAVAPQLARLGRRGGSLMRAARDHVADATRLAASGSASGAAGHTASGATPPPVFASFDGGMSVLVDRLTDALKRAAVELRTGAAVERLTAVSGTQVGWRVTLDDGSHADADAVVLATPAHQAAPMLADVDAEVARSLADVAFASVAIVTLGYSRSDVKATLNAAGALVPRQLGLLTTAASFGSSKWPHWADAERVVIRASVGRVDDRRFCDLDDDELVERVAGEVGGLLEIDQQPLSKRVSRWADSLPQYTTGHTTRVRQLRAQLTAGAPGLVLAGASYDGIGIPACVSSGNRAAQAVADHLAHLPVS